uniref:Synaptotagmin Vb n=1 Tax=Lates calcarifer TaxID=8187 RepID=A0A4W6ER24_LATCA
MRVVSTGARARRAAEPSEPEPEEATEPVHHEHSHSEHHEHSHTEHHPSHDYNHMKDKFMNELSHLPIPMWAVGAIVVVVLVFGGVLHLLCFQKCFGKKKSQRKKVKERLEKRYMEGEVKKEGEEEEKEQESWGKLEFSLDYNFTDSPGSGYPSGSGPCCYGHGGTSDPYVKVFLLPDKKKKYETKVQRKNLCPVSTRLSSSRYRVLDILVLVFQVVDDMSLFTPHEAEVWPMSLLPLVFSLSFPEWRLSRYPSPKNYNKLGDICISLRYVPTAGKLTVNIMEAKNLKKMDVGGLSGNLSLLQQNGKRIKKKKTTVKKTHSTPTLMKVLKVQVVITVFDYDKLGSNDPIGKTFMGYGATGVGLRHWSDMLANPRRPVAQWHTLMPEEEVDAALKAKPR